MGKEALVLLLLLIAGCAEQVAEEGILPPELPVESPPPALPAESPPIANIPAHSSAQTPEPEKSISPTATSEKQPEAAVLTIPPNIENSCIGFKINSMNKTATINKMGAGWANMHWPKFGWGNIERAPGVFDFSEYDQIVRAAQQNNVAILAELLPFADWDQGKDPKCKAKENDYICKPKDMEAYKKFVSRVIERYDGDGKDDMPGLKIPIKYWQVLSEPDIKEDPYVIFFVGDEQDYLDVLKESYITIKQECPDCKVVQGAAAGVEPEFLAFWDNFFKLGGADYFDIADVHYVGIDISTGRTVGLGDASTLNAEQFKELLDKHNIKKPLWVSEAVIGSYNSRSSLKGALASGASKVFFVESDLSSLEQFQAEGLVQLCPKIT